MDVDNMEGSILEAMARAVEEARIVLVCYSEKYKDSQNCRTGKTNCAQYLDDSKKYNYYTNKLTMRTITGLLRATIFTRLIVSK